MTLGFPDHLTKWELSDAYREAYLARPKIIPHEIVADGPVLENVLTGADVDVTKFPAPVWHEKDGGRYIGTGTFSITRDPEENWLNAGAYRAQVHSRTTVGLVMAMGHHGAHPFREIQEARREDAGRHGARRRSALLLLRRHRSRPTARSSSTSSAACAAGPMKMVQGQASPACPFPANAEIVLEGYVDPGKHADRRPVRRMERPLCGRRRAMAGARRPRDLSPQRSDPPGRAADGRRARTRWRATAR